MDSLENGELNLQVNLATDIDSHISKNNISHSQVTAVKGKQIDYTQGTDNIKC
jgi:hypothetical protein